MASLQRLTKTQLIKLESILAAQDAPVVQHLQPGASSTALTTVEGFLGMPVPDELRQWWEWHDGTDIQPHERAEKGLVGPLFQILSTARAIEFSRKLRGFAVEDAADDPDELWGSTWIAIGSQGRVACECNVEKSAPVPVLNVDYHKVDRPGETAAHSLGEMVSWWIEALESGAWRYDPEHDRWDRHEELIPRERESKCLV